MPSGGSVTMTKEISEGIKALLGKHVRILMKCAVKMESKGDKTENRILVFCPCRLFCLKVPPRIDFHFHYLEIQAIESRKNNQLVLTANDKSHSFVIPDPEKVEIIDKMIVTLLTALNETFPGVPLYNLVRKIDVFPTQRLQHLDISFDGGSSGSGGSISGGLTSASSTPMPYPKSKSTSSLEDNANSTSTTNLVSSASSTSGSNLLLFGSSFVVPGSVGPCGGFSTQYAWMCDLLGLPYREEVSWDVDTIYLSHDSRELCLNDFDHLEPRDLTPILSALEYNNWFKSLKGSHVKLSHEAMDKFLHIVRKSVTIEELHFENIGAKTDFAQKLSAALSHNTNSQVHTIDLSHNMIEDKGAIHLSSPLAKLCRGPVWLNLSSCGLSAKGVAQLAHALALNRCAPNSLTHLNLAGNSLKDDINNLCNFLATQNSITYLDLSGTDCNLETVFGALLRGCTSHLAHLNLSRNNFSTKKGKEIPPSFKQFLTSNLALKNLALSSCKLSLDALKQLLLGLACNENTAELELDISSNGMGAQGAHVLESCLHGIKCLASLDISDNNLDGDLAGVITAAMKNKSLKHLNLGRNLQSTKAKHVAQVMEAIVQMLQEDDCVLQTISLADSKLKGELFGVINAIGSNQTLQNIDISGNQCGDVGARLLAKALQINSKLRCITYDKNNITLQGFSDIAYGLESNMSVRYIPFPVHDVLPCMKVSGAEKTESVMKRIQDLIYRNSQPQNKTSSGHQFRLQQGFLLSSAQQTVDKLISQTQDGVKLLKKNEQNSPSDSNYVDVINHAETLIQNSERAKQLLANLHELIEQKGEAGKVIESKLQSMSDDLHSVLLQHIQKNIDTVLELGEERCPNLMGDEDLKQEIREGCIERAGVSSEFVKHCVMDIAGADIINKLNEVNLAVAAHISDKLVDRAIDSLMKCHKQLNDASRKRSSTPDVLKNRLRTSPSDLSSKEMADAAVAVSEGNLQFTDQSPMKLDYLNLATPQMQAKRKTHTHSRRMRPKSVVDCVEGLSADDIPDLLPSLPKTIEETISQLQDLPPISPQQLKHLGKARPKKPKTRAPTRPSVRPPTDLIEEESSDRHVGIETFFRPGSATPIVTPDSDECSTSLMISLTSETDTSIQSPTHSSRTFKADADDNNSDRTSPGSFDSCSIASKLSLDAVTRSKSTDCLEKKNNLLTPGAGSTSVSPVGDETTSSSTVADGQKSPVQRIGVSVVGSNVLAEMKAKQEKRTSGLFSSNSNSISNKFKNSEDKESVTVTHSSLKTENKSSTIVNVNMNSTLSGSGGTVTNSSSSVSASKTESSNSVVSKTKEHFSGNKNSIVANAAAALNANAASNVNKRPPPVAPKPRPWSVVGSDRRSGEFSLSDGSSPLGSNANTPESGELLDDHGVVGGKVSPMSHNNTSSEPMSLPPNVTTAKLSSSPSNQTMNRSLNSSINSTNNNSRGSTGGGSPGSNSNSNSNEEISRAGISPVSLPVLRAVGTEKRSSVKELAGIMAASLARQSQSQNQNQADEPKKKADSLPRNVPPPSSNNSTVENQDFNRARVQEWSRHHSISEVWKVPLRKFSAEKPVAKPWGPNNDQKSPTNSDSSFGIGRSLRKVSNDEDVVNV
ncbi:F-actin-uncapping protein LRRC16A isoform X3 [Folsomia candida]|uniref:F-actin-uncapping protein LRRC16A isoform X3 n=1 Tax=Folsomia candida TaxID=158441 RepID=UPI0016053F97|nr:F-actin-uncapping protein LRRC16A isoform X3 [Folsomia candida]